MFLLVYFSKQESLPSPYTSFKKYEQMGELGNLVFDFKAGKAKLMRDTFRLLSASEPQVCLELHLVARVLGENLTFMFTLEVSHSKVSLGKGQGTPMLKDGIHNIAVEVDEESEASDWQGFE